MLNKLNRGPLINTRIGTAGWTIPSQVKTIFGSEGTHLERYSGFLTAVEINSSFYREHKPATYAKWSACVPDQFRFSVKLSRHFTHQTRLQETGPALKETIQSIAHLGEKFGVLLVQLPPSLVFHKETVTKFVSDLREIHAGDIAWEPRHVSWAWDEAVELFEKFKITRVFADPEPCPTPPDIRKRMEFFRYIRLHGSPKIYQSRYAPETIEMLAQTIRENQVDTWVIFDNTTFGYATENALELQSVINNPFLRPELPL